MSRRHVVSVEVEIDLADVATSDLVEEMAERARKPGDLRGYVDDLPDELRARLVAALLDRPLPLPERTLYPEWARAHLPARGRP